MDLMEVRRRILMLGGGNELWNKLVLTANETLYTNTDIKTWIENNVPAYTLCMAGINDDNVASMATNHFIFALGGDIEGTRNLYSYTRRRNNGDSYVYQARSFSTTEDCVINQGESITIFYQQ